jgi:putative transposase
MNEAATADPSDCSKITKERPAMAAEPSLDLASLLGAHLESASPDVLQTLVKTFADALMSAEADALCGAGYGERTPERTNSRNGYRHREWDTRAGTVELAIPKLRTGSYFPDWLLEHRRRAEQALVSVVATSYLLGVSTRRMEKLVEQLGVKQLSKSQVSEMARHLDAQVEAFRSRPLDQGPYTFVWTDALVIKVREHGRTVNVHALVAVGVNADGGREVLGIDICSDEDGAGWLAFLRSLTARGLSGVRLIISDAHRGLVAAIGAALPGTQWQRCRTHYLRNLLAKVPKSAQPWVATLIRTIFDQPDAAAVTAQFERVLDTIAQKFPAAAEHLDDARADLLAFTSFPRELWRQIWSNNPQERLNKEIRRRTDVVGIFPNRAAIIRLVGAVLAEQTDEWVEGRRYMGLEILAKARLNSVNAERYDTEKVETTAIAA